MNPQAQHAGLPAMGGIGSAASFGKFYAMLATGGKRQGRTYLAAEILTQADTTLASDLQ